MALYQLHDYERDNSLVETDWDIRTLKMYDYIRYESTQVLVENLRVGDEQICDNCDYYIRRTA